MNAAMIVFFILYIGIIVFMIISMWKVFKKANQPGWAAIVPYYNYYIMVKIAKKPDWWLLMIILVPIANIVFLIMTMNGISKNFGKDSGFTVGLVLLPMVFWPILGFGNATYIDNEKMGDAHLLDS